MSSIKADKYIDLKQFPRDKNGNISWKDSVGMIVDFYYYNEKHTIKIIDYISLDYVEISIDDMPSEVVGTQKIRRLYFDYLFYKPNYIYSIGDVVNDVMVLEQLYIESEYKKQKCKTKHYKCKCLKDGYEYITSETDFKKSKGCPVCAGKRVLVGCNDLANRSKKSMPLMLSDKNDNYIGVYMSAQQMANEFTDETFVGGSINACAKLGKPYKGYIIRRITWDEYESLQSSF